MPESHLPEEGSEAPDFTLPDQDGDDVTPRDLRGQPVVLYFYPKADTPGLHDAGLRHPRPPRRLRGRRRARARRLAGHGRGVKKFHDKQALDFTLLADEDHAVCDLYGVWGEKSMYGKTYWACRAPTFIIDARARSRTCSRRSRRRRTTTIVLKALARA